MTLPPEAERAIEEEEEVVAAVTDSLAGQLHASSTHFNLERARARELTSELVAATREEDRAMLASDEAVSHALSHKQAGDIETLQKLLEKPYFARFAVSEKEGAETKVYEYKLGFAANPDCRIVDWRKAPISKLYYNYKEGEEYSEEVQHRERNGVITLRNAVEIDKGALERLSCRHGTFVRRGEAWQLVSGPLRPRDAQASAEAYARLPDVLSLITPEQFKAVTEEAHTAVLIQGIAGSGKTTVALHRLAWLLHEDNSSLKAEQCTVIVLSQALKTYISNTLPSINVRYVRVITFREWTAETIAYFAPQFMDAHSHLRRPEDVPPHSLVRLLRSMALLGYMESAEAALRNRVLAALEKEIPWSDAPPGLRRLFDDLRQQDAPLLTAVSELLAGVDRGLSSISPSKPGHRGLQAARVVLLEKKRAASDFGAGLAALFSRPEELLSHDETKLLDKGLVGEASARLQKNLVENTLDYACDAVLLRLLQLRTGQVCTGQNRTGSFGHIVVDEVQDLGPVDLSVIIKAVKKPSDLTLVGDVAQKIDETAVFPGWRKLMQHWDFKADLSRYLTLTVSHRSTLQIMRLAEHVQNQSTVTAGRAGRVPIWFRCRTERKGIRAVIDWLEKALHKYPTAVTAVICPASQEAKYALGLLQPSFGAAVRLGDEHSFSFEEGIVVTDIRQVKGLEFLNVLLWNPTHKFYPCSQHGRNLLYTAITRAEENLCLVTWGKAAETLPDFGSVLVRGVDMTEEEEEEEQAQ